jgi:hypothetical protein
MRRVLVVVVAIMWAGVAHAQMSPPIRGWAPPEFGEQTGDMDWSGLPKWHVDDVPMHDEIPSGSLSCKSTINALVCCPTDACYREIEKICRDEKTCYKEPPRTIVIETPNHITTYRWCYKEPNEHETSVRSTWVCWKKDD